MGGGQQPPGRSGLGRSLQDLQRRRGQDPRPRRWASHWKEAASTTLLIGSTQLQDLSGFWGNEEAAWTVYLTLSQVDYALICWAAALLMQGRWKWYWIMAGLWFIVQAVDEILFGNTIINGRWEYLYAPLYALLVYFIVQRYVPHEHQPAEPRQLVVR